MNDIAISVKNISKYYRVFDSLHSQLLHALWPKYTKGMQEIRALRDINLEIRRGEAIAIIGRNGSGKSTLLEILTGTLSPSKGEITVNGRVAALLELGSGFNPEYSGRDNVILNGLLLGLSKEEILNRFSVIESFSEIGDSINRPLKTYSSGMTMRLAFAVQVLCDPDILIIDEALSVGDFFFQQKCFAYIRKLRDKGVTLIFVSHDMGAVRDLCSRVIYLSQGRIVLDGIGSEVLDAYFNNQAEKKEASELSASKQIEFKSKSEDLKVEHTSYEKLFCDALWKRDSAPKPGRLLAVSIDGSHQLGEMTFLMGQTIYVRIAYMPDPNYLNHISLSIFDKLGTLRTVIGSLPLGVTTDSTGVCILELSMDLMFQAGLYSLGISLAHQSGPNIGCMIDETGMIGPINITWNYEEEVAPFLGPVGIPFSARYIP